MARQERPTGDTPLEFWAVLMEGVLRQRVGRPMVMHDQLQHLADLAEHLNITVQELPFSRGAHPGMFGPCLMLSYPRVSALDLVLTETPTGNMWIERESDVARYRVLFDEARTSALPPTESLSMTRRIAREHRPCPRAASPCPTSLRPLGAPAATAAGRATAWRSPRTFPRLVPVCGSTRPTGPVLAYGHDACQVFVSDCRNPVEQRAAGERFRGGGVAGEHCSRGARPDETDADCVW